MFRAAAAATARQPHPSSSNITAAASASVAGGPSSAWCQSQRHQQQQYRSKHSATQVKRLFKNNPARLRILKKAGWTPKPVQIPDRAYPPVFKPTFLSNGWSAPPPPEVEVPEYPFRVTRTGRKPFGTAGFLPVYRDIR